MKTNPKPKKLKTRDWRKHFKDSPHFKLDKNHPKPTVFVAMSGGVDSSVTAYLLKEEGYQIVGVYMKNWSFPEIPLKDCQLLKDYRDMVKVCKFLRIPYLVFNFEKEYKKRVMEQFFAEYRTDRTPNPDILCNTKIKFDLFLNKALDMGADFMATGHHVRRRAQVKSEKLKVKSYVPEQNQKIVYHLLKGVDPIKDQTYFVYNLTQKQLSHCLFPIGEYPKSKIREIAHELKLPTAYKRDSQGICFIGNIDVKGFLKTRIKEKTGDIIDMTGKVLGKHEGAWFYTIGQRRIDGLSGTTKPLYVVDTDVKKNLVIVGPDRATYKKGAILEKFHLIDKNYFNSHPHTSSSVIARSSAGQQNDEAISSKHSNRHPELTNRHPELVSGSGFQIKFGMTGWRSKKLTAKPRYGPDTYAGKLAKKNGKWQFVFNRPQRALTPGQSLVIYDKDVCLGGGVINRIMN